MSEYNPFVDEAVLRSIQLPNLYRPDQMTRAMEVWNAVGLVVKHHDDREFQRMVQRHFQEYGDVVQTIGICPWKDHYKGPGSPQLGMERLRQVATLYIVNGRF